jgi:hypothetical protein
MREAEERIPPLPPVCIASQSIMRCGFFKTETPKTRRPRSFGTVSLICRLHGRFLVKGRSEPLIRPDGRKSLRLRHI